MRSFRICLVAAITALALFVSTVDQAGAQSSYSLEVFKPEHQKTTDPETGAELTYLTTNPAHDSNLYFHERSWLADSSLIIFNSDRAFDDTGKKSNSLMGYIVATGELVRLTTPKGAVGAATCAVLRNSIFGVRGGEAIELALKIEPSTDPLAQPSRVIATERVICTLTEGASTSLNESCDGRYLACGKGGSGDANAGVQLIDVGTGAVKELCKVGKPPSFAFHVQWSHTNPNLLSFAGLYPRLHVVDVRDGIAKSIYNQLENELVTHEHWWVDDQMVFCGGLHQPPSEDASVKVIDVHTGEVRIIGAGSWWPEGTEEQVAKRNYWHCAGSDDGRWIVADNWHGDMTIFEAKTTRPLVLTTGHRNYGSGDHPHVGWDRLSRQVIFASHKLGDVNVCVATIPPAWQEANH